MRIAGAFNDLSAEDAASVALIYAFFNVKNPGEIRNSHDTTNTQHTRTNTHTFDNCSERGVHVLGSYTPPWALICSLRI